MDQPPLNPGEELRPVDSGDIMEMFKETAEVG